MTITKEITIGELIQTDLSIVPILMRVGMNCFGCSVSHDETLEEACYVHDIDVDTLVDQINEILSFQAEAE